MTPDAELSPALARQWREGLAEAERIVGLLPADLVGTCVLERNGSPARRPAGEIPAALASGDLLFHPGSIRGALPRLVLP